MSTFKKGKKIGVALGDFGLLGNVKNYIAKTKIENVAKLKVSGGILGRDTHNPFNTTSYKKYRNAKHMADVEYKISKNNKRKK